MELKLTQSEISKIVLGFDLECIKGMTEDEEDDYIHEIILECMSHEEKDLNIEPSKFDELYAQYETIVYDNIRHKYHYLIYRTEKNGQTTLIDTAQDRLMLHSKLRWWREITCAYISFKREAITRAEWKERYC